MSFKVSHLSRGLFEVLEVDILWPRWVARIGVTRATEACFLAADRQCTELPLLRLPRLVHGFRGSDPMRQTRDLARVGWRGLAPFLPIGPRGRPRLADSFSRLGQARGASPGSLDQRSEEWPLCEGKSGARDVPAESRVFSFCQRPRKVSVCVCRKVSNPTLTGARNLSKDLGSAGNGSSPFMVPNSLRLRE